MAKPEKYDGKDGVKVTCLREYTVKGGTGPGANEDQTFEAGKSYVVGPRSAAHLLRQVYNARDENGKYIGDAPFFVDEVAAEEMAKAEKAAKASKAKPKKKPDGDDAGSAAK